MKKSHSNNATVVRVRKTIPVKTSRKLWVKSGGRCEYRNCNKDLLIDSLTKRDINKAYISHIVPVKVGWKRGDKVLSSLLQTDFDNLMLLCDECHNRIDISQPDEHPVRLLKEMKKEHERRIERVTNIIPNMFSYVVIYRANIGGHQPQVTKSIVYNSLLPDYYPADNEPIDLGLINNPVGDADPAYWIQEVSALNHQFNMQIKNGLLLKNKIPHISLFAFAPQPLLIKLGTLFSDIPDVNVFQPIRIPKTWRWQVSGENIVYKVIKPESVKPAVALNISLSATINNDRIEKVLGTDCSIYTLTIDKPFNDYLKTKKHLDDFTIAIRESFNLIKSDYNAETPLHIFPAMPVSAAVELGRRWMPKADMPLIIYDENNGGFREALRIGGK